MAKLSGKDGIVYLNAASDFDGIVDNGTTSTVTTTSPHSLTPRSRVKISDVGGATEANGHWVCRTVPDTTSFTIALAEFTAYTSGGTVQRIVDITNWSCEIQDDLVDTTDSSHSNYKEYTAKGIKQGSGSMEGFFYEGNSPMDVGTQFTLIKLLADSDHTLSGAGYVSSVGVETPVSDTDVVKVTINFNWSGTITEATS